MHPALTKGPLFTKHPHFPLFTKNTPHFISCLRARQAVIKSYHYDAIAVKRACPIGSKLNVVSDAFHCIRRTGGRRSLTGCERGVICVAVAL